MNRASERALRLAAILQGAFGAGYWYFFAATQPPPHGTVEAYLQLLFVVMIAVVGVAQVALAFRVWRAQRPAWVASLGINALLITIVFLLGQVLPTVMVGVIGVLLVGGAPRVLSAGQDEP